VLASASLHSVSASTTRATSRPVSTSESGRCKNHRRISERPKPPPLVPKVPAYWPGRQRIAIRNGPHPQPLRSGNISALAGRSMSISLFILKCTSACTWEKQSRRIHHIHLDEQCPRDRIDRIGSANQRAPACLAAPAALNQPLCRERCRANRTCGTFTNTRSSALTQYGKLTIRAAG